MKKVLLALLVSLGLQTQAQINPCDSVEYAITSTANTNLLQLEAWVNGTCPVNFPCIVSNYSWTVCDDNLCYGDTGTTVYFQQFMTTDTIKVCLTTDMTIDTMTYTCMQCDSLVFGPNGWMLMSMGNPTAINELQFTWEDDGIIYDLMGRKVIELQVGQMYIRNNKKYIRVK
jgi:hypothetical protein